MPGHFRRYLWINIGIIAASFAVFGLIFYFMSRTLAAKADQILADRAVIANRAADTENLSQLKNSAAAAEKFQEKIDALLPSRDGLIAFPQFLDNLARTHSLELTFAFTNLPVPPAPPTPGYVEFNAVLRGSPASIRTFTDELEHRTTRFMVNLRDLEFSSSGGSARADLAGRVFFRESENITP